ncbi:hypothetical protein [Sphingomonas beigongshangi]|uniref:hypothetical protein n=1 Tax=Sphingomonas beigongshangi TaxID=2782540 RepID=UPI001AEEA34A|nr:hypothetical protein [Sphingomonas beigongshangi]
MSETADQARTRRRWITLAELVAVAGVVIAALTLYLNVSDRRADEAARAASAQKEATAQSRVALTGTVDDASVTLKDPRHDITDTTILFPKALGVGKQAPVEPRIDADMFRKPLLKLTDGGPDTRTGRLPVLITTRYWDGDTTRSARGLYDIIWRTHGRRFFGRALTIEGFRLRQTGGDAASLESAWAAAKPR